MASDRHTFVFDISQPWLVSHDLANALNRLPEDVRIDLAMTVKLVLSKRLVAIEGGVARPTELFVSFLDFVESLVDEIEAPPD
jgi:hypothetical protein